MLDQVFSTTTATLTHATANAPQLHPPFPLTLAFVVGPVVLWFGMLLLCLWHYKKRLILRRDRTPEDFVLLRGPGEYLRDEMFRLEERTSELILTSCAIFVVALAVPFFLVALKFTEHLWVPSAIAIVSAVIASVWTYFKLTSLLDDRRNYRLGYLGERMVGEQLQDLARQGWWVYHDVPASENGRTFNLDHVVVGRGGIVAVEVKTPRKHDDVPGLQKLVFNGATLQGPWGESDRDLQQADRQAAWLQRKLRETLHRPFPVRAVLAYPGWRVDQITRDPQLKVVSGRAVTSAVVGHGGEPMSHAEVTEVVKVLDDLCRNVTL